MILKFFRRKPPPPPPRDTASLLKGRTAPAILAKASDAGSSYFGGEVELPKNVPWPSKDGRPLTLLACIDLEEARMAHCVPWLPASGRLLFFYDIEQQPWGYDPKDRGSWSVIHITADTASSTATSSRAEALARKPVGFVKIESIPSYERVHDLNLNDAETNQLFDLQEKQYQGGRQHQLGGYPSPAQGDDMELECQLASAGVYCGNPEGYKDPRVATLKDGAKDWRLLLQFDSDDDLGVMWGDCGKLYFWVREQDSRAGRFENVWLVLQCS